MKKFLLIALLPLGLFAKAPKSTMSPIIYDLTGIIRSDQHVVSMVTDEAKLAQYSFNPADNYLTIATTAAYYYAAVTDSEGNMSYLYLGPKSILQEPSIQELPLGPTPVQKGLKTAGKGTAISLIAGLSSIGVGIGVAQNSSEPFAGLVWFAAGAVVAVYGTIWSVIYGTYKGVQTSIKVNNQIAKRKLDAYNASAMTFVVLPVELGEIPEDLRTPLLVGQR